MEKRFSKRFWEIDAARGAAIILMVLFHIAFDVNYFVYNLDLGWVFWYLLPRFIASIFIILVGISLTLNYNKSPTDAKRRFLRRGLEIFFFGIMITLATYLFLPKGTIFFGILHFIGISTMIAIPFVKLRKKGLFLGLLVLITGFYLQTLSFASPWLLWLGFMPTGFYTFDYFPIFPWFGLILIGIYLGNRFYESGSRKFRINELRADFLTFLGRNSLVIYLLHQPVIILLIAAIR
ncbi:MAG: DUF1624 domain-containing protein [Candidatus Aenigmarchaeota archaeon]|nr:DUF1624 domain-containing protein [Candidatus Aenigmarchaeota archaeon]